MPNAFVDSNDLIYAADESLPVPRNTAIARELLRQRGLVTSVQVLNEFIVNARKPTKLGLSDSQMAEWHDRLMLFDITSLTVDTYLSALTVHARYQISHWDSLIVASALQTGCETIYSENLNHGQDYGGVRVINPFL
jgi:predicted nucleic acid-binding protein